MRRALLLVMVMLLAGCTSEPAADTEQEEQAAPRAASASYDAAPSTGRLEGVVQSAAHAPIGNAVVSLERGPTVTADDYGRFFFGRVPTGLHVVNVEAEGYVAARAEVRVSADDVASLIVIMERPRTDAGVPYSFSTKFDGFAEIAGDGMTGWSVLACTDCAFRYDLTWQDFTGLEIEARMDEAAVGENEFWLKISPNGGWGNRIHSSYMDNPGTVTVAASQFPANLTSVVIEIFPYSLVPEVAKPFEVMVTSHHRAEQTTESKGWVDPHPPQDQS